MTNLTSNVELTLVVSVRFETGSSEIDATILKNISQKNYIRKVLGRYFLVPNKKGGDAVCVYPMSYTLHLLVYPEIKIG